MTASIELGDRVETKIGNFGGIVVARAEYLYGTARVLVQAEQLNSEGSVVEIWYDEPALVVTGKSVAP